MGRAGLEREVRAQGDHPRARQRANTAAVRTYHVHIGSDRAQIVVRQLVDQVARAQDVLNLAGLQEGLELLG